MNTRPPKPPKPYKSFPLFPHANGQWAKKIRGKLYYFGTWDDPNAAMKLYEQSRDSLQAGLTVTIANSVTVERAVSNFLIAKDTAVQNGEINLASWKEYQRSCKRFLAAVDRKRACESLNTQDFARVREQFARSSKSPKTLKNELTRIKVFLRWAYESRTVPNPLPYELALKPPSMRLIRTSKATDSLFSADEILSLVSSAEGYLKAAILLGINCGLGNRDVCELQWNHVRNGQLDFARNKTGVERRAILWPETISALDELKSVSTSTWVCSGRFGQSLIGLSGNTPIAHEFRELMQECKLKGRGFYCLRRTYRTIADEQGDQPAIMLTMGHEDRSMNGVYRQTISGERLQLVSEYVRNWLHV